ncbi:hypothetical protein FSP39_024547 [Pinctada imbricata]|uniref:G-protein coupled receptors family 1 profile domain-containing protein n=1 Tax=Pinctada imbricata TaxID=66713 RepID=A0AA88YAR5_PINIB|nr:hypothetical protein FSP39_024547 [Pinctada imbricata]
MEGNFSYQTLLFFANVTDSEEFFNHPDPSSITYLARKIFIPIICLFGLAGNIMSAVIYFGKEMRKMSCSIYLGARSVSDTGYIITLLCSWLDFVDIRIVHLPGLCQLTIFMSYVCSFMSIWCVVFVTYENFVRICKHDKVTSVCTVKVARYATLALLAFAVLTYNFHLWGVDTREIYGKSYCMTRHIEIFTKIEMAVVFGDTLLTLIIPLVIIMIFMSLIFKKAYSSWQRFTRREEDRQQNMFLDRHRSSASPHSRVAKLLTTVSVLFVILHTPSHVMRIKEIFEAFFLGVVASSDGDRVLQHIFSVLYYMNFAINWFVYIISGKKFRRVFYYKFIKCKTRSQRDSCLTSQMNTRVSMRNLSSFELRRLSDTNSRRVNNSMECSIYTNEPSSVSSKRRFSLQQSTEKKISRFGRNLTVDDCL